MRTLFPIFAVMMLGISGFMVSASGFGAIADGGGGGTAATVVGERVQSEGQNSSLKEGVNGSAIGSTDNSIIGMVFSSVAEIVRYASLAVTLPLLLRDMGFPAWFAFPIGGLVSIVVSVGLLQFVTGREWR